MLCWEGEELLYPSFFAIGVKTLVGNNNVVYEVYAHSVGSLLYGYGYAVVFFAGWGVAAGVVVAQGNGGGVFQQCFFKDYAHVDGGSCYASVRNTLCFDKV